MPEPKYTNSLDSMGPLLSNNLFTFVLGEMNEIEKKDIYNCLTCFSKPEFVNVRNIFF